MRVHSTVDRDLGLAQLELSGHVTPRSAQMTRRLLRTAETVGFKRVIIDLRELDDVDSHLALALLDFNKRLADDGGWLWLVHSADNAGSSLRLMGVHDRVRSSPSREAAGWLVTQTPRTPQRQLTS